MKIYSVWDTHADSWSGVLSIIHLDTTEKGCINWLQDNYHHSHHDKDHFWWMDMEISPNPEFSNSLPADGKIIRDFRYFYIGEHEI